MKRLFVAIFVAAALGACNRAAPSQQSFGTPEEAARELIAAV